MFATATRSMSTYERTHEIIPLTACNSKWKIKKKNFSKIKGKSLPKKVEFHPFPHNSYVKSNWILSKTKTEHLVLGRVMKFDSASYEMAEFVC